jgi:hypothetical protein
MDQCGLSTARTVTARVDSEGGTSNLIALAGNYKKESMILPPAHKIEKLKELFEVDAPPEWYLKQ